MALALVGAAVGTATGAVTPFQQVIVKNTSAEPIPVTGTVNVANTPANQPVTVTNFPASQPVSGTVNVGSLPLVTKKFTRHVVWGVNEEVSISFGQTINVTALFVADGDGDNYDVHLGGIPLAFDTEDNYSQNFTVPVPASGALLFCSNSVLGCAVEFSVWGY
jgi:hypothetical protein